jgi:hypothetical protein
LSPGSHVWEEVGNEEVLRYGLHDSHLKPIYVKSEYNPIYRAPS